MNKDISRDFLEHMIPVLTDYLAVVYFLNLNEVPPKEPDLPAYIHNHSGDAEFIDYLILTIHRLIYFETFGDEMKTGVILHSHNMEERKEGTMENGDK